MPRFFYFVFLQLFRNFINKFIPKCFGSLLLMMAAFSTLVIILSHDLLDSVFTYHARL